MCDAESYNAVMKAYKQAKDSAGADGIIDAALKQATSVPLGVAERAREVVGIVERLGPVTNPNMKSDLTTATALARAAIEGALANVEINLESLKDAHLWRRREKRRPLWPGESSQVMHLRYHRRALSFSLSPLKWAYNVGINRI